MGTVRDTVRYVDPFGKTAKELEALLVDYYNKNIVQFGAIYGLKKTIFMLAESEFHNLHDVAKAYILKQGLLND